MTDSSCLRDSHFSTWCGFYFPDVDDDYYYLLC